MPGLLIAKIASAAIGAAASPSGSVAVGASGAVDGVQNTIAAMVDRRLQCDVDVGRDRSHRLGRGDD